MINLEQTKYKGATADQINEYNWILKDKIVKNLDPFTENSVVFGRNFFDIWDPIELKFYICEQIR